ncbi:MAG: hypothetical protein ACTHJ7_07065, partial [Candidatus Nitrosocosmicus sp.]
LHLCNNVSNKLYRIISKVWLLVCYCIAIVLSIAIDLRKLILVFTYNIHSDIQAQNFISKC